MQFLISVPTITLICVWAFVIIIAVIIESQTANLVSIWFAVAAIPALILTAIPGIPSYVSFIVFIVLLVILLLSTRTLGKKIAGNGTLATNVDKMIGMQAVVTKKITQNEKGAVKVDYETWSAISEQELEVGTKVIVKNIEGNHLVVGLEENVDL
jgi:membrane protein implicated in regulation of membrane protease activity